MNGGVNGTMEEAMDTSPPNSPTNVTQKVTLKENDINTNHCDNSDNTEIPNHIVSESSQDPLNNSEIDNTVEDGKDPISTKTDKPSSDSIIQENHAVIENNCSNSNLSCSDSITSSQPKSDTTEQPTFENVVIKCKQKEPDKSNVTTTDVNMESEDEVDSEEDSSDDEEESEDSNEPRDTVSINSDSENSRQSVKRKKNNDIILVENDNARNSQNGNSEEVHEIVSDNDDCVVTSDNKKKTPLRRSSRAIKRKVYADEIENGDYDDESDVEEVELEDPLNRCAKPIVINDTKTLVEMASKHSKNNQNNQKKEPTVVIIDTNTIIGGKESSKASPNTAINSQMYQNIVSRGTSVTMCPKSVSSSPTPVSQSQPSILPSLTDDMFVVEAPSFIVPYVYEKPSVKPFREFVDVLGKELEEQRAKEEQEKLEKESIEKQKSEEERRQRKERGEEVEESEEEVETTKEEVDEDEEEERKKKKAEKKERRRRRNEDDDASWDGESSSESDDDISDEEKTVVIKDKVDSIEEIKEVTELTADKVSSSKPDNYFDCSLGKFFINIGINLVQEYVQQDLLKQQNRKLYKEKKTGQKTKATESSIASLTKNLEFSKKTNLPYSFPQNKCEYCSFKTESKLVMSHHLETPHMKNNVYRCNFCEFEIRSPHDILYHMESQHNVRGKLERAPAYHQCANCPFEDNGKGKLARHLIPCAKKFKPEINLAPPTEWEPPAKIPKITRNRNNIMNNYQNAFTRAQIGNHLNRPTILPNVLGAPGYRPRGRGPLSVPPRGTPVHGAPLIRGGVMVRHNTPVPVMMPSNYPVANNGKSAAPPKSMHQPSISITPLPRAPVPTPTPTQPQNKGTFVICEICDGYIKDLEQLRNHMQWIHKVKIHPKMIYNRPPLNCQKCQFRFFTDQGLERHLLGSHGLVTSSMQEAANKGKDAGRCPVCGRVYQWKLLSHVGRDHNLTLKPAHLSYKCTVCTATFGMYKQFENHVYSAHSVVAKRVMDKNKTTPKGGNESLLKPLKINDEITIIPQPAKASPQTKDK